MKYKLIMNGLDCAHCAGKIEQAVTEAEGFENVSLVFATKSLYFEHDVDETIIDTVQKITDSIEDGVSVSDSVDERHHCHDEHCDCSDHGHHHEHGHGHGDKNKLGKVLLFVSIAFAVTAASCPVLIPVLHRRATTSAFRE